MGRIKKFIERLKESMIGRCCGDCVNINSCYSKPLDRNSNEAPACKEFKER